MAVTKRTRKNGEVVFEISYTMTDPHTGEKTRYCECWHPGEKYSAKVLDRMAKKEEGAFIERCKRGEVLTKRKEKERQREQAARKERERLEQASKPTYQAYLKSYLDRLINVDKCAKSTVSTYGYTLERAIPWFGELKMEDISKPMIRNYINDLAASQYGHDTVKRHFSTMARMFAMAVEDGVIPVSPMEGLKPPKKGKGELQKEKVFQLDELHYILECLEQEPLMWKALITFMIETGCRRGEAAGLKWESVHIEEGNVCICNNRQYTPGKGAYDTTPKNGKGRSNTISEHLRALLKAWRREQMEFCFCRGIPQPEYCFTVNGHAINPSSLNTHFKKFGAKYGIPDFHPHKLRHTNITISIAEGADVRSVSERVGHSHVTTTLDIYTHLTKNGEQKAASALEAAIYSAGKQKKAQ